MLAALLTVALLGAGPAHLSGLVVDQAGQPVANARVDLRPRETDLRPAWTQTGADGRFQVAVDSACYGAVAVKEGYGYGPPVELCTGYPEGKVTLAREAVISGVVIDPENVPVTDCMVAVRPRDWERWDWDSWREDATFRLRDAAGAFELRGLSAGEYDVGAFLDGGSTGTVRIRLTAGETSVIKIRIVPTLVTLRGRLVDFATGAPLSFATVDGLVATDADGRFELEHPPTQGGTSFSVSTAEGYDSCESDRTTIAGKAVDLGTMAASLTRRSWRYASSLGLLVLHDEVQGVRPASPAAAAGIRKGDRIVRVGSWDVSQLCDYALDVALSTTSAAITIRFAPRTDGHLWTRTLTPQPPRLPDILR